MAIANAVRASLRAKRAILAISTILSSGIATAALAQSSPNIAIPPQRQVIDENGVNTSTGAFVIDGPTLTIGTKYSPVSYKKRWVGAWNDSSISGVYSFPSGEVAVVNGGTVSKFTVSGTTFTAEDGNGETLSLSGGVYTFTLRDGSVYIYDMAPFNATADNKYYFGQRALGVLESVTKPSGERYSYSYGEKTFTNTGTGHRNGIATSNVRPQSITSSSGYQLKFLYAANDFTLGVPTWQTLSKVYAINNAVDTCDPAATSCTGLTQSWPTISISSGTSSQTFTDALGRATVYTFDSSSRVIGIQRPSSSMANVSISYNANGGVSTISRNGLTWAYTYSLSGSILTTTITNPDSSVKTVVSDTTVGLPTQIINELGKSTTYSYDSFGRLSTSTLPEGDATQYIYDSRGNVLSTVHHSKPGSGASDISTSASYPTTCTNALTCNQPTSATDALGNQTDYTYDPTHGGVLTITNPAPTAGAIRPQTRYTYSPLQAYYKNTSGTIVASGVPTYRLTGISTCQTVASCGGGANEVSTTIAYDVIGGTSNLIPTSISKGAGDGSLVATTAFTFNAVGDMVTVDGPLAGTADALIYRYDIGRELVGVVLPDPDGAGPLKRRAVRVTYTADGLLALTEVGTVNGTADSDWSAFASNQQTALSYDASDRKTLEVRSAGGATYKVQQYSYDSVGQLQCIANRMNSATWSSLPASACTLATTGSYGPDRITKVSRDVLGRAINVQTAYATGDQANEVTRTYNGNGTTASVTDAQGNTTNYVYDGFDRLSATYYPSTTAGAGSSSTTDFTQLTYDAAGEVTSRRLRDGNSIGYTYDHLGRMTYKTPPTGEYGVSYSYDLLGHLLLASRSGDGVSQSLSYDALSRKVSETQAFGSVAYQYDISGRKTIETWPDGFYVNYDHLVTGEVSAIRENGATSGIGVLATYTYDDLGRRVSLMRGNGSSTSYGYDAASRLTSLVLDQAGTSGDLSLGFSYSPADQITSSTRSNDVFAWSGAASRNDGSTINGLNQMTTVGAGSLSYDAKGNLSSTGATTFSYDSENHLRATNGGISLFYDPSGRLVEFDTSTSTRYVYDGSRMAAAIDNPSGAVVKRFVFGPNGDEPLVEYDKSGSTFSRTWLHADERGSIIAQSDDTGAVTAINTYDEYGVPGAANAGTFQYTGQAYLAGIGAYYYKSRLYSSRIGRYLQTDPQNYDDGLNWYNYVHSDPINSHDTSGDYTNATPSGLTGSCDGVEGCGNASIELDGDEITVTANLNNDEDDAGSDDPYSDSDSYIGGDTYASPFIDNSLLGPTPAGSEPFAKGATLTNLIALDGANVLMSASAAAAKLPDAAKALDPVARGLGIAGLGITAISNGVEAYNRCASGQPCAGAVGRAAIKTAEAVGVFVILTALAPETLAAVAVFAVVTAAVNYEADEHGAYDYIPNALGL